MNKRTKLTCAAVTAALALLFAGSAAATAASAFGAAVSGAALYAAAAVSAALCALGALSSVGAIGAAAGAVILAGVYAASHFSGLAAMRDWFASWGGAEADPERILLGGRTFLVCAAFFLGALFFALLNRRELAPLGIAVLLGALVASHAMSNTASVGAAVPGLIAAAGAFALTGGVQRDGAAWRALLPAALAMALALLLSPPRDTTWKPMADAAERVRSVFEQYFNFTRERIAFSIAEQGYDHAGELDGEVVPMLGGPAEPHTQPVMTVQTGAEVLLRGSVRSEYTGYSWVDTAPRNRYLYYDLTHRGVFNRVFDRDLPAPEDAFLETDVAVEILDEGTSTLFVPCRVRDFSMDLSTAVYYNTAGEMFLSRPVRAGDRYSLKALIPAMGAGLRAAVERGETANDGRYSEILAAHSGLPAGIDERVYALTVQITGGAESPYDRAVAIADYLRRNMRYTLQPDYPPHGQDFVSWFLLDSREGYCSSYATAMAVMGRIAGLPTRYVEGYLARPDADGQVTLTGEDAHAWAEVYFRGVGWIPFDATAGAEGRGPGDAPDSAGGDGGSGAEDPSAEPSPTPTLPPQDGAAQDMPTPTPEPQGAPNPPDQPQPEEEPPTPDEQDAPAPGDAPEEGRPRLWKVWLILLLLALIALAALWVRARLRRADPMRLCNRAGTARDACMILYRAMLTQLSGMGQGPANGESPESFAARVSKQFDNPDYAEFARAVSNASYGRRPLKRGDVETGLRAYAGFNAAMGRREKLRFAMTRVFRGLGDFEVIP